MPLAAKQAPAPPSPDAAPIRVMLVDDSAIVRGLVGRWVDGESDLEIVARCVNGADAVRDVKACRAEVVVLDIEMPQMDGLSALPKLLKASPGLRVVMSSTLTDRNADISLKALELGASDYVCKPSSRDLAGASVFRTELIGKVKALGRAYRRNLGGAGGVPFPGERRVAPPPKKPYPNERRRTLKTPEETSVPDFSLRAPKAAPAEIIAIGSSTGGPQALKSVLEFLSGKTRLPILIVQHMPKTFTSILAEHLTKATEFQCQEGASGLPIRPGNIYVAPGGQHMVVANKSGQRVIELNDAPPENFCRPAVDPMFRSVAKHYGPACVAVILTGMGSDGALGGGDIAKTGAPIIAQDKHTSVVWGMPGAAATAGICSAVLPLNKIGPHLLEKCRGVKS